VRSFFKNVLPANATYAGAVLKAGSPAPQHFFTNDYEYLDYRLAIAAATGFECYFACAGFSAAPEDRKDASVFAASCIQHDIDVGKPGAYATAADARAALSALVKTRKVPRPTQIVSSGGGLHVYWAHIEAISPDSKRTLGRRLAAALRADPMLCVDMSATTKVAPLLRWPGTFNWKTGQPREVYVSYEGPQYSHDKLSSLLPDTVAPAPPAPARVSGGVSGGVSGSMLGVGVAGSGYAVDTGCAAVRKWKSEHQDKDHTYHIWAPLMHLTGWLDNAEAWAQKWSEGPFQDLPRASEYARTAVAHARNQTLGPTTCKTLLAAMGMDRLSACAGCPLMQRGDKTSPAFLGAPLPSARVKPIVTSSVSDRSRSGRLPHARTIRSASKPPDADQPPLPWARTDAPRCLHTAKAEGE
jgi:hypothetical protein